MYYTDVPEWKYTYATYRCTHTQVECIYSICRIIAICRLWDMLGQLSRQVLWDGCVSKKAEILQWWFATLFLDGNFVLKLEVRPWLSHFLQIKLRKHLLLQHSGWDQVHCFFSPVSWVVSRRGSALQIHDLKIAVQSCSVNHVQKATENISNYSVQHLHNLLLPPTCRNLFCKALNPREV